MEKKIETTAGMIEIHNDTPVTTGEWVEELSNTVSFETELIGGMNPGYSSIKGTDRDTKIAVYNLWTKPNKRVKECAGQVLEITDIMCETVNIPDRDGVIRPTPRLVLVDKDMNGYVCLSVGIYNQLKKLIQVFGEPHWEQPLKLKPYIDKRKGWEMLNFELIP